MRIRHMRNGEVLLIATVLGCLYVASCPDQRKVFGQDVPKTQATAKWVEPKTSKIVWEGSRIMRKGPPQNIEPFEVLPSESENLPVAAAGTSIELPKQEPNEESSCLIVNQKCQRALIGYVKVTKTGGASGTRLVMCDLKEKKVIGSISVPSPAVPLDLADDGEHIVVRFLPQTKVAEECHVEVWRWGEKPITREVRFLPLEEDSLKMHERLTNAAFLDNERLVTMTTFGQLTFWDWRKVQRYYIYDKFDPFGEIEFTAGKKYVVAPTDGGTLVAINTASYTCAGYWPRAYNTHNFRLNPSAATVLSNTLQFYDTPGEAWVVGIPKNRAEEGFTPKQLNVGRLFAYPNDGFALYESLSPLEAPAKPSKPSAAKKAPAPKAKKAVKPGKAAPIASQSLGSVAIKVDDSNRHASDPEGTEFHVFRIDPTKVTEGKLTLIDLQYQVRAWEYTGVDRLRSAGSECWCLTQASKEQPAKLMLLTLPGKELHDQVAKAITEPDYYVLAKGGAVKLDLTGLPAGDRKAVVPLVEKQLKEKQVTVEPESDITLVFNMGATRDRKVTAFSPGDVGFRTATYTYRQRSVEVTVEYKGQPVHSMTYYADPVKSGTRQPNESLQQFHDRNPMPIPEIVKYLTLPRVMFGPQGNKFIGTTNVTETAKAE